MFHEFAIVIRGAQELSKLICVAWGFPVANGLGCLGIRQDLTVFYYAAKEFHAFLHDLTLGCFEFQSGFAKQGEDFIEAL